MLLGPNASLRPFVVVVVFKRPVVEAGTAPLACTALSTFLVVLSLTVVFVVVWVTLGLEVRVVFTLEAWVEIGLVVWLVVKFGVGTESPPTFLPAERVVLAVVLVVTAGAAALTFVVVMIRPPDFGVVMVVLEDTVVVEFDTLVVVVEAVEFDLMVVALVALVVEVEAVEFAVVVVAIELDNLVVVEAVEFELMVVALAALVVAVEFDGATVVAFDLMVVVEVAVELPDLKAFENYFLKAQPLRAYLVVTVGAVAVVGDTVVLTGLVIVPLFVSWIQLVRLKILT